MEYTSSDVEQKKISKISENNDNPWRCIVGKQDREEKNCGFRFLD